MLCSTGAMTVELIEGFAWVAILATAVVASTWLWRTLGVLVASQGLVANTSALVFAGATRAGWGTVPALALAMGTGALLGLGHLALLRATNRDVLLVASVLLSFFWADLWLSLPSLTGGSGGLLLTQTRSGGTAAISAALALCFVGLQTVMPLRNRGFLAASAKELGLSAGVLGVPVGRVFVGGFAVVGGALGLLGAAGAELAGMIGPSLFSTGWSLSILVLVVAPAIPRLPRTVVLPAVFIASRWLLRETLPPSIGSSQLAELFFPAAVLAWSRMIRSGRRTEEESGNVVP